MSTKIIFHLNSLGYGGTEKAVLTFCQNLDRSKYSCFIFVNYKKSPLRYLRYRILSFFSNRAKNKFIKKFVSPLVRKEQFANVVGEANLWIGNLVEFFKFVDETKPDILHFNRGDWSDYYDRIIVDLPDNIHCVETNIFGKPPSDSYLNRLDKIYFVSHWLINKSNWHKSKGKVLFNPIKAPATSENLRDKLGIPSDVFVMGRISRPDLVDDLFLIDMLKDFTGKKFVLIIVAGSDQLKRAATGVESVIFLEPTINEVLLSKFYNTIDILLHHRIDGETFGMNIAEGMMHGKPVISHLSHVDNAQAELLDEKEDGVVGFVSKEHDMKEYVSNIKKFMEDPDLLKNASDNAHRRAFRLFHEAVVTKELESNYRLLLAK